MILKGAFGRVKRVTMPLPVKKLYDFKASWFRHLVCCAPNFSPYLNRQLRSSDRQKVIW